MQHYIQLSDVSKIYANGDTRITAVSQLSFFAEKGEFTVITGPSGAGKTTVLNMLGGMDSATGGKIEVDGEEITALKGGALNRYRREDVGFVFQFYNLMPNLTTRENVELAAQISRKRGDADKALREVGLYDRRNNFPSQLSGGEQQRAAIARALVKNPKLLLCDEPTGALDYVTGKSILRLLHDTCREREMTVIIITHNGAIAPMADRVVSIRNGTVLRCETNAQPLSVDTIEW